MKYEELPQCCKVCINLKAITPYMKGKGDCECSAYSIRIAIEEGQCPECNQEMPVIDGVYE